jgi:hypothetical protein
MPSEIIMNSNSTKAIILGTSIILSCIIIGLISYGTTIFNPHHSSFTLVIGGLYAATFISILYLFNLRDAFYTSIILFLIITTLGHGEFKPIYVIRDIVWFTTFIISLYIYRTKTERLGINLILKPLFLAVLLGVIGILNVLILYLLFSIILGSDYPLIEGIILYQLKVGFLVGFAIGLGSIISENYLFKKISKQKKHA